MEPCVRNKKKESADVKLPKFTESNKYTMEKSTPNEASNDTEVKIKQPLEDPAEKPVQLIANKTLSENAPSQDSEDKAPQPVTKNVKYRKPPKNVLTRIENLTEGPLALLKQALLDKRRVKVLIRSAVHVRSICTGYVLVFDKHMNMALSDVEEVYRNPLLAYKRDKHSKKKKQKKHKLNGARNKARQGHVEDLASNSAGDESSKLYDIYPCSVNNLQSNVVGDTTTYQHQQLIKTELSETCALHTVSCSESSTMVNKNAKICRPDVISCVPESDTPSSGTIDIGQASITPEGIRNDCTDDPQQPSIMNLDGQYDSSNSEDGSVHLDYSGPEFAEDDDDDLSQLTSRLQSLEQELADLTDKEEDTGDLLPEESPIESIQCVEEYTGKKTAKSLRHHSYEKDTSKSHKGRHDCTDSVRTTDSHVQSKSNTEPQHYSSDRKHRDHSSKYSANQHLRDRSRYQCSGLMLSGRDQNPKHSGRDHSTRHYGRNPSLRHSGRDHSPRNAGRDHSPRNSGRDHSPRHSGRDHSPRHFDREHSPRHSGRENSPWHCGRDHSPRHTGRDHSPTYSCRHHSPRHSGREHTPRHSGRDYNPRHSGREYSPKHSGKDHSPRYSAKDQIPRHSGRDQSPGHCSRGHSPRQSGRDNSPMHSDRDQSPRHSSRGRSPRHSGRDQSPRHSSRDHSPRHSGRYHSPRHSSRDQSPRHAVKNYSNNLGEGHEKYKCSPERYHANDYIQGVHNHLSQDDWHLGHSLRRSHSGRKDHPDRHLPDRHHYGELSKPRSTSPGYGNRHEYAQKQDLKYSRSYDSSPVRPPMSDSSCPKTVNSACEYDSTSSVQHSRKPHKKSQIMNESSNQGIGAIDRRDIIYSKLSMDNISGTGESNFSEMDVGEQSPDESTINQHSNLRGSHRSHSFDVMEESSSSIDSRQKLGRKVAGFEIGTCNVGCSLNPSPHSSAKTCHNVIDNGTKTLKPDANIVMDKTNPYQKADGTHKYLHKKSTKSSDIETEMSDLRQKLMKRSQYDSKLRHSEKGVAVDQKRTTSISGERVTQRKNVPGLKHSRPRSGCDDDTEHSTKILETNTALSEVNYAKHTASTDNNCKDEVLKRHIGQLFIRGDNIVMVVME